MPLFDGALGLVFLGVWVFCIIDVITTPDGQCRNLPKLVWLLIVILLMDIGSIAWLLAGRAWTASARPAAGSPARTPGRPIATNPDDDEDFLASLRSRAEEQRRRAAREGQQTTDEPDRPADET